MEPRTLEQLVAATREERLNDTSVPPRWPDPFLFRAFAEAEAEAAERAKLLRDIVTIELVEGQRTYVLPTPVFEVVAVRRDSGVKLSERAVPDLDREDPYWRERTATEPGSYVVLAQPSERLEIELVQTPVDVVVGTALSVEVYRRPLYSMEQPSDEPEINARYHENLMDWVCYRAYLHRDPDLYDPAKAADFEAAFERHFGPRITVDHRRQLRERRRHVAVARDF